MEKQNKRVLMITDDFQEIVSELVKRSPAALATALVIAMAQTLTENKEIESRAEFDNLIDEAGTESIRLVDGVYLLTETKKETLH
jgi:hypothetical protein